MNVFCLSHNPGVSKAILDAAGPTVENECKNLGKDHSISHNSYLAIADQIQDQCVSTTFPNTSITLDY